MILKNHFLLLLTVVWGFVTFNANSLQLPVTANPKLKEGAGPRGFIDAGTGIIT